MLVASCANYNIEVPKRTDFPNSVNYVFVIIDTTTLSDEFVNNLTNAIESTFRESGIDSIVRQENGLELSPITKDDLKYYSYVMRIRLTKIISGDGPTLLTLGVILIDLQTGQEIMNTLMERVSLYNKNSLQLHVNRLVRNMLSIDTLATQ